MRILFVHERHGFHGGVEQNVYDTAVALRARGHVPLLSAREGTGRDERKFDAAFEAVAVGWIGASPVASDLPACDVVYVHKSPETRFVEALSQVHRVRAIHDHDVVCPRRHKYYFHSGRVCDKPVGWRCYADLGFIEKSGPGIALRSIPAVKDEIRRQNSFDRVIANSEAMATSLKANGVEASRVSVIHPVVPVIDDPIRPLPQEPRLLFVGQLIRGKGVDLLLHSLAKVQGDWRLDIAGDGNMRGELESLATTLGLQDKVRFLGWVPSEQARRFYDEARIVCVPSRWPEPFGMVGIEAMRRARPVIAFEVGGIPDWLSNGETGFLVPEQDIDAFAARVQQLLTDHCAAERMGMEGKRIAEQRFDFDSYIDRLEAVLS